MTELVKPTPERAPDRFFVTGGTLSSRAPSYLERAADNEIYNALLAGDFCYVLTSRQMGKSSLLSRASARLRQAGCRVSFFELSAIGINVDAAQWFDGILERIGADFGLEDEIEEFRERHGNLGPQQMWLEVIRRVVLEHIKGDRIIVIVDEIDLVRSLRKRFDTDEFFAGIRELYNRRSHDPVLERLTFCLLGVASPGDLIEDKQVTPFNIGCRIELRDFTLAESMGLLRGFPEIDAERARPLLERVHYWSGGQPYLTQMLAKAVAVDATIHEPKKVDSVVEGMFLSQKARDSDPNLAFVRDRVLKNPDGPDALLKLYRRILKGAIVSDSDISSDVTNLKLAGLVCGENGKLRVKNPIYAKNFDLTWVRRHLTRDWSRLAARAAIAAVAVLLFACLPLAWFAFKKKEQADKSAQKARDAAKAEKAQREKAVVLHEKLQNAVSKLYVGQIGDAYEKYRFVEAQVLGEFSKSEDGGMLSVLPTINAYKEAGSDAHITMPPKIPTLTDWFPEREKYSWIAPSGCLQISGSPPVRSLISWPAASGLFVLSGKDEDSQDVYYLDLSKARPQKIESTKGRMSFEMELINIPDEELTEPDFQLVPALEINSDGSRALMVDFGGNLRQWDLKRGREITLRQPLAGLVSARFVPKSDSVIVARHDGSVSLLAIDGGSERKLESVDEPVRVLACAPNGEWMFGGGRTGSVSGWDLQSGKLQKDHIWKLPDRVMALAFSPDSARLLMASIDGTIELRGVATGELIGQRWKVEGGLESCVWSPDGRSVLVGGRDGKARLFSVDESHTQSLIVAIAEDDKLKAVANEDYSDGKRGFPRLQVAFGSDGRTVFAGNRWDRLGEWEASTGKPIVPPQGLKDQVCTSFAIAPNDEIIRAGIQKLSEEPNRFGLYSFERADDKFIRLTPDEPGAEGALGLPLWENVSAFAVSSSREIVAVVEEGSPSLTFFQFSGGEKSAELFTLRSAQLRPVEAPARRNENPPIRRREGATLSSSISSPAPSEERTGDDIEITQLAFSQNGKFLAVGFKKGDVALVDLEMRQCLWRKNFESEAIHLLGFLDRDQLVLAGSSHFKVYSVLTQKEVDDGSGFGGPVAFGDDGLTHLVKRPDSGELFLRLSPDELDYTIGVAHSITSWKAETTSVAVSADCRLSVQGTSDGRAILASEGTIVEAVPINCGESVDSVSFLPDGKQFVTGDSEGNLRFWRVLSKPEALPSGRTALDVIAKKWMLTAANLTDLSSRIETDEAWRQVVTDPKASAAWYAYRKAEKDLFLTYYSPEGALSREQFKEKIRSLSQALEPLSEATDASESLSQFGLIRLLKDSSGAPSKSLIDAINDLPRSQAWAILSAYLPEWERVVPPTQAARWHLRMGSWGFDRIKNLWSQKQFQATELPAKGRQEWSDVQQHLNRALQLGGIDRDEFLKETKAFLDLAELQKIKETVKTLSSLDELSAAARDAKTKSEREAVVSSYEKLASQGIRPRAMLALNIGISYRALQRYEKAKQMHALALQIAEEEKDLDTQARAYISMAYTASAGGNKIEARRFATKATTLEATFGYAWINRAMFEMTVDSFGANDKAELARLIKEYSTAADLVKDSSDKTAILFQIGSWFLALNDETQAIKIFGEGLAKDESPANYKSFWEKWEPKTSTGDQWAAKKLDEGIAKSRTREDGDLLQWLISRKGSYMRSRGLPRDAVGLFLEALAVNSTKEQHGWATTELAETFRVLGDLKRAIAYFTRGEKEDTSRWVHVQKALTLRAQGNKEAALAEHEAALKDARGGDASAWQGSGVADYAGTLASMGGVEQAIGLLDEALSKDSANKIGYLYARAKLWRGLLRQTSNDPKVTEWRARFEEDLAAVEKAYAANSNYLGLTWCALLRDDATTASKMLRNYRLSWRNPDRETMLIEACIAALSPTKADPTLAARRLAEAISFEFYDWERLKVDPVYATLVAVPEVQKVLQLMRLDDNSASNYAARDDALANWAQSLETPDDTERTRLAGIIKRFRDRPLFNPPNVAAE